MDIYDKVAELKARLKNDSNDIDAAISLGNLFYDNGDAGNAITYYLRALDLNPDLSGVRTDLGTMYWRNNEIALSEQAFRDVIARDPGFGHAYVNLGLLLYREKNDVTGARAMWQQMLTDNPGHPAATKAREMLLETAAAIIQH